MDQDLVAASPGDSGGIAAGMASRADGDGRLSTSDRRFLLLLGLPSFALALAVTTVSSLLPVLLQDLSGTALAGSLLAVEGAFALVLPPLIGAWSDRHESRIGPRLPFVIAAVPLLAVALALMAFAGSLGLAAIVLVVFYLGYFTYFTAHFALYIDLVPERERGRSQGAMNLLREGGLALALVGGPALLMLGRPIPFAVAAVGVVVVSAVFVRLLAARADTGRAAVRGDTSVAASLRRTVSVLRRHRDVRLVVIANALWETALNALRSFVVLYFTVGLGYSAGTTSLVLLLVAVAALVVSPITGWAADRFGELRVLRVASVVYAAGVWPPAFLHPVWLIAIVPPVSAAAVVVMTLPFALLSSVLPEELGEEAGGGASGLFGFSRGIGLVLGPLLGGASAVAAQDLLASSNGYGAIFLVAAVAIAASVIVLRQLREEGD